VFARLLEVLANGLPTATFKGIIHEIWSVAGKHGTGLLHSGTSSNWVWLLSRLNI
jgi:hypothetical protein